MKLSDGVEWGVHVTTLLAVLPPDRALPAAKLAEYHGVPAAYLAKHLQALSRAGILVSVQGPRGGYRLARPGDARSRCSTWWRRSTATSPRSAAPRSAGGARPRSRPRPTASRAASTARWTPPTRPGGTSLRAVTVAELVDGVMREASPAALAAGAEWIQEAIA